MVEMWKFKGKAICYLCIIFDVLHRGVEWSNMLWPVVQNNWKDLDMGLP